MLLAHNRSKKNKTYRKEVIKFELNLESNIINLVNDIKNSKYEIGEYREFLILDPKERLIKALPYRDRIVHQWYIEEFIIPYIVPKFIHTTFACLKDKGTHNAVDQTQKYMRACEKTNKNFWILKCDIKKFFYNIDKNILFNIVAKYMRDNDLISFTHKLLFDNESNIGIPIGNYTSQYFANIYLNELDQFVKRVLKLKYYVRYMDDFVIMLDSKEECKKYKDVIETFLNNNLKLQLNDKSRYYPSAMGVNFCGYRIFTTHKLLRTSSKKKIKQKVKKWNKRWHNQKLNINNTVQSLNSWIGHASHCNSYHLQKKIINKCDFLLNDNLFIEREKEIIDLIEKTKVIQRKICITLSL